MRITGSLHNTQARFSRDEYVSTDGERRVGDMLVILSTEISSGGYQPFLHNVWNFELCMKTS